MNSDRDVESEMQKRAKQAVESNESVVPGVSRLYIEDISEYDDFVFYAEEIYKSRGNTRVYVKLFLNSATKLKLFADRSDFISTKIGTEEARKFNNWLKEGDRLATSTREGYIRALNGMASFYVNHNYYDGNPFAEVIESFESSGRNTTSLQSGDRVTVGDSKLRKAIRSTHGSNMIVLLALLIKTGARISEICNLNWRDIHLNHDLASDILPNPRVEIDNIPDIIYFDEKVTEDTYQVSTNGNKRVVPSVVPIDGELKRLLLWHALSQTRHIGKKNPVLMVNDAADSKASVRLNSDSARIRVTRWASNHGMHESGRDEKQNVTPHWFRAKFSTYMIDRLQKENIDATPREVVKGLRGDVGKDVIETYRLEYDQYRDIIRKHQFKIGLERI